MDFENDESIVPEVMLLRFLVKKWSDEIIEKISRMSLEDLQKLSSDNTDTRIILSAIGALEKMQLSDDEKIFVDSKMPLLGELIAKWTPQDAKDADI